MRVLFDYKFELCIEMSRKRLSIFIYVCVYLKRNERRKEGRKRKKEERSYFVP